MNTSGGCFSALHSFSKDYHANMIKKKKARRIILARDMLTQNSYNLLIIFLVANGGWPSVTNFTLVEKGTTWKLCFHELIYL